MKRNVLLIIGMMVFYFLVPVLIYITTTSSDGITTVGQIVLVLTVTACVQGVYCGLKRDSLLLNLVAISFMVIGCLVVGMYTVKLVMVPAAALVINNLITNIVVIFTKPK